MKCPESRCKWKLSVKGFRKLSVNGFLSFSECDLEEEEIPTNMRPGFPEFIAFCACDPDPSYLT